MLPRSQNQQSVHIVTLRNNPSPKRHHLNSLIKSHKHKKPRNAHTRSLLLPNLLIDLVLPDTPPNYPTVSNPVTTDQIHTHIHQAQAQQQQTNTQTLLPYSGFIANATLQQTSFIFSPSRAPQPELIKLNTTAIFYSAK